MTMNKFWKVFWIVCGSCVALPILITLVVLAMAMIHAATVTFGRM